MRLIKSPAISKSDKQSSLIAILKKAKANNLTIQFCGTLAGNGRLNFIIEIIDVFYQKFQGRMAKLKLKSPLLLN